MFQIQSLKELVVDFDEELLVIKQQLLDEDNEEKCESSQSCSLEISERSIPMQDTNKMEMQKMKSK